MKYLCLVYCDGEGRSNTPYPDDDECKVYAERLTANGYLLAGEALASACTTTIRVRNSQLLMADGPCSGHAASLVGFYLMTARDLNHAIQMAADSPAARAGSIEVWPVRALHAYLGGRAG